MVRPQDVHEALSIVSSEDFDLEECRLTIREITAILADGLALSWDSLLERLKQTYGQQRGEDIFRVSTQSGAIPLDDDGSVRRYALRVRNNSACRQIVSAMESVIAKANELGAKPAEVRQHALELLWGIRGSGPDGTVDHVSNAVKPFLEQVFREKNSSADLSGLGTGIHALDQMTTGIRGGEFWVVGALPGRGKTSLGMQFVLANVDRIVPTLIFSLEMSKNELLRRMEGQRLGMVRLLRSPQLMSEKDWSTLAEDTAELAHLPLHIDDSPGLKISDLVSNAHLAIKQRGVKLVVVDYLQLLRSPGKELRERVGYAANQLRELAKSTGVPVVALSQLRRPQGGINTRPTMLDLRETGEIEAHAHTVVLLYQPLNDEGQPTGEDEIIIGKQRNGSLGTIPAFFNTRSLSFHEREMQR